MNKSVLARLLTYVGRSRRLLVLSVASAVLNVLCTLFAPLVIGRAIDRMAGMHRVEFSYLFPALLVLAGIFLTGSFFLWLLTFLTNRISYRTVRQLRSLLFDKLRTLPLSFFDRHAHGDTASRFVNDVDAISDGLLQGFMALLTGAASIIGSVVFMLFISPGMTLVVVLSAPAAFLVARFIAVKSQSLFRDTAKYLGQLNGYAEEIIEGQEIVTACGYEDRALQNFQNVNAKLYRAGVKSQFIAALSNPSTRIVNNITYAVIGVAGGAAAILGKITVGDIGSFLIYSTIFAKPFNDITNVISQIQSAIASAQRVFDILDLAPETPDDPDAAVLSSCRGNVRFDHVFFSYNPGQKLIEDFTLDIPAGSRVAIVGHTGAGKTTLVNLLMRFYDADSGSIQIDGVDIRRLRRKTLRDCFGMVLQDTWLFDGSVRDNIAYAKPGAAAEEIVRAAKAAGADGFIRRLPEGYETRITAAGDNLSQGQKQLLTIARVMLADPPMLILDEATSNIDTYTEMRIQKAFDAMTAGRTSFVIAHRLSTVKNADRILVMEAGHIVESGTHAQLLQKNGVYAELYNSQFKAPQL